jgi:oxalate decarboxylase/phosphoglucose isomerase-like protein (cupin superfamily)
VHPTLRSAGLVRYDLGGGSPRLEGDWAAVRTGVRYEKDLAEVNPSADPSSARPVYWTFSDVARDPDREGLARAAVTYDLTFISPRLLGREHPRTHGHTHASADEGVGALAEVYEVLAGRAGILLQDLAPGPRASLVVLIQAEQGDVVAVPPGLFHATINLGSDFLMVADVVCRLAVDSYERLRGAGGMAYGIDVDGTVLPNPSYASVASLRSITAGEWGAGPGSGLYARLVQAPRDFAWLCDASRFVELFPGAAAWTTDDREGG